MAPGETCRLIGHYRSDGSRIDVLVHTVRLSEHSDRGDFYGKHPVRTAVGDGQAASLAVLGVQFQGRS
jgi:hypothetical protein